MNLGLAAAILALTLSSAARAQQAAAYPSCEHPPSASDVEAAKGLHTAAQQYYLRARYDRAITSWLEAYGFDCQAHRLLINIGNAYEKLGETEKAIEAFETYLERTGDEADPTIADKVENLKRLAAKKLDPPPPPPPPLPSPPPPPPPPNGGGDGGPGAGPWVLVGVGAAATIAGAVLLGVGTSKVSAAESQCPNRGQGESCPQDIVDDGNLGLRLQRGGAGVLAVGLAAAAAGFTWYIVDASDDGSDPAAAARPTLVVVPGFAGLGLAGRF